MWLADLGLVAGGAHAGLTCFFTWGASGAFSHLQDLPGPPILLPPPRSPAVWALSPEGVEALLRDVPRCMLPPSPASSFAESSLNCEPGLVQELSRGLKKGLKRMLEGDRHGTGAVLACWAASWTYLH